MSETELEEKLDEFTQEEDFVDGWKETEAGYCIDLKTSEVDDVKETELWEFLEGRNDVDEVDEIISGIIIIVDE